MIDYSELTKDRPQGEGLEQLTRLLLTRLGLTAVWTGRGADSGKDLIATEIPLSPIRGRATKWLVSCKDHSHSGKSVVETELPNISDKLTQHGATAFLLVTTTTASTSAKAILDGLNEGGVLTKVWDRPELDRLLLLPEHRPLLKQFFPESYLEVIRREPLQASLPPLVGLPKEVVDKITELLAPYARSIRFGSALWPEEPNKAREFERLCDQLLVGSPDIQKIATNSNPQLVDVTLRILAMMSDKGFEEVACEYARALVEFHRETDCSFNSFQFLVDREVPPEDVVHMCQFLSQDSLEFLYFDEVSMYVEQEINDRPSDYEFYSDVDSLSSNTRIGSISIDSIDFEADGVKVSFSGSGSMECELEYDHEAVGTHDAEITFTGYFDSSGMYLESVEADTSSFYE